ncbi:MAG: hypothetical protein ACOCV2_09435 [Persicimonas sp.]
MRRIAVRVVALIALFTLVSCASSPSSEKDEAPTTSLDDEASELLLTEQTPFVLRTELDEWSSVQPFLEKAADSAAKSDREREEMQSFIERDPWGLFTQPTRLPVTDEIREAPVVWMTGGVVGGEEAFRAQSVGVPFASASESPRATYVRLVFPANDPGKIAESLEKSLEEAEKSAKEAQPMAVEAPPANREMETPEEADEQDNNEETDEVDDAEGDESDDKKDDSEPPRPHGYDAHNIIAHDAHVQLDLVDLGRDLEDDEVDEIIARIEERRGSSAPTTPAFEAFGDADNPAALYIRTTEMNRFVAGMETLDVTDALAVANPDNHQNIMARHSSNLLNSRMMAPPSQREYEDTAVLGRARGEDGLAFEMVATRTKLGKEIHEASATEVDMPSFNTETLPDERLLAEASWAGDLVASARTATPLVDDKMSLESLKGGSGSMQNALPGMQQGPNQMGGPGGPLAGLASKGPLAALGAAHSPTYLIRAFLSSLGDDLSALVPTAIRGRLVSAESEDAQAPVVGALAIQFPASVDAIEEFSSASGANPQMLEQFGVSQRVVEDDDGSAQLHLAFGASVEDAFVDESEAVDGGLTFHARAREIEGHEEEVERIESVASSLDFRGAHTPSVGNWGVSFGRLDAPSLDRLHAEGDLATNEPDCLIDVVRAGSDLLGGMEKLAHEPSEDVLDSALGDYDKAADACAEESPDLEDRLTWAKARARLQTASMSTTPRLQKTHATVKRCRDQEDEHACSQITGKPAEVKKQEGATYRPPAGKGHDVDELDRLYTITVDLYEEACDGGIQPACDDVDDLPDRDDILWTPDE